MVQNRMCNKIAVIGIGYVGLPLLEALGANEQNEVFGFDISKERVSQVRSELASLGKHYMVTSRLSDIASANVYIITVPTPTDQQNKPDLTCLLDACKAVASVLSHRDVVIFESTVYPTMTEDVCIPLIEKSSGLCAGLDFYFGYSPERINIGDPDHTLNNTIKIVAGCDSNTTERIATIYESIKGLRVDRAVSIKVAEAAKLMENTQRDILIAFANEYSEFCAKIGSSIEDVIATASSKWNFAQVYPGLVGGHCISIDPYYLLKKAADIGISLPLVMQARRVNEDKASKVAQRLVDELRKRGFSESKQQVLILGFAYKKNCSDIRNTKVACLARELENRGCVVHIYDPLVDRAAAEKKYGISMVDKAEIQAYRYQALLVAVHHDQFKDMTLDIGLHTITIEIEQLL